MESVVSETRRNLDQGLALRRPENSVGRSSVKLVRVDGDVATLQECVVDDGVVYRYATNEVVNATVATHSVEATTRRAAGPSTPAPPRPPPRRPAAATPAPPSPPC